MTQFSEQPASFTQDRGFRSELNAEEEAAIAAAREILFRHISRNPVLTSWAAVVDYCSLYADAEIMPMLVSRSLFLAEIAGKGLA